MPASASGPSAANVLYRYGVLDTPSDPAFDRLAQLAADITGAPIALICLFDGPRIWFKARVGTDLDAIKRSESLCTCVVQEDDLLIVEDLHIDPRFENPELYAFDRSLRFYAGIPLTSQIGGKLGTMCVLDHKPHPRFDARTQRMFESLAEIVVEQLDLHLERKLQASQQAEIDLIFEMQSALEDQPSFLAALEATVGHMVRATDAAFCRVWEWPEPGNLVTSLCVIIGKPRYAALFAELNETIPVPVSVLHVRKVFQTPGSVAWEILTPRDDLPDRLRLSMQHGIGSLASYSMLVGGRRFALLLAFEGVHGELAEMAERLGRLSQALRPVLQRKMDDEKLKLLSSALSSTTDGVMIALSNDPDGPVPVMHVVNAAFCQQTGYSAEQLVGQTPFMLYADGHDPAERQRMLNAMWAGRSFTGEVHRKRQDGSTFWAEMTINPLHNDTGRITHWVTIQRDTTEKRAAVIAQREREEAIRNTAEQLSARTEQLMHTQRIGKFGHWRWDSGQETLEWSDSIYPLFGVTPETFSPTINNALGLVHPDDREQLRTSLYKVISSGTPYTHEYRAVAPDGVIRHHWSEARCERDANGELLGITGIVQDITERKEAQAMLLRTEKLRSVGQLTGGIAHDFNNLLTVISVNLEMMSDLIEPDHPAEDLRLMALRAAESGAQLTASLLAFARRQPLKPILVAINQALSDVRLLAMRSLGERHQVKLMITPDLPTCRLDRAGFEGSILNLLLNSRDAMPDGGTIEVTTGLQTLPHAGITLPSELPAGDYVTITVADTGTGIPADLLERVFEPFFTTKPIGKGSGLGLSTVIGFVRQSGGEVDLSSVTGRGTTVRLYLPAVRPAASAPMDPMPGMSASSPSG